MQRLVDKRAAAASKHFPARADEEHELALLTQFMRHDSVASLAEAIAARSDGGMSPEDLIATALGPRASDS
jgi:hypothetical protein